MRNTYTVGDNIVYTMLITGSSDSYQQVYINISFTRRRAN